MALIYESLFESLASYQVIVRYVVADPADCYEHVLICLHAFMIKQYHFFEADLLIIIEVKLCELVFKGFSRKNWLLSFSPELICDISCFTSVQTFPCPFTFI